MHDRYKKRMTLGQDGNALVLLLASIAIIFCIFQFIYLVYYLSGWNEAAYFKNVYGWFQLPADPERLMYRPWTILTYMFIHFKVWHLIGNLIWLWAFGYILQDLTGNRKLIPIFIYGGLAGALVFVLSYNLFPRLVPAAPLATLEGASAGVMAIAIATTSLLYCESFFFSKRK